MCTTREVFQSKLKELRERDGLSRKALAEALNISTASIGYYEHGDRIPDIEVLTRISDYFNVSCDYLLRGIDSQNINIQSELGFDNEAIEYIKYINNAGYINVLSDLLTSPNIITLLDNIYKIIETAYEFDNDTDVINDVFNEFVHDMQHNEFTRILNSDEQHIRFRLYTACQLKYDDKVDYYYYKSKKELESIIKILEMELIRESINKMVDKIYLMYLNYCEEASDNGEHNPKKE